MQKRKIFEEKDPIENLKNVLIFGKNNRALDQALSFFGFTDVGLSVRNFLSLGKDPFSRNAWLEILPFFLAQLRKSSSPDLALTSFERFSSGSLSRSTLYSLLKDAPKILEILIRLFGTSPSFSEVLIRNPEYLDWIIDPSNLQSHWTKENYENEIKSVAKRGGSWDSHLNALRRFKRRQMLRIGIRDLMGFATLEETTRDLSFLADVCLDQACDLATREMGKKYGEPKSESHPEKTATLSVIGMGKLGGLELNYSSDIDVMFIYSDEGMVQSSAGSSLDNHTYFSKLAEKLLQAMGTQTSEGYLYRVDTRLRPEGTTGPLVRSLESYEIYYASWGQCWERQALIKARVVAGDEALGKSFLQRIQPFVYRKYIDYKAIDEMKTIKGRIEYEVEKRGEQDFDVKLGIGGIREIEFGLQILQLLYGGRIESLRLGSSLAAIQALSNAGLLEKEKVEELRQAYLFLRRVENLLQLEHERQTHVLPSDPQRMSILAHRLGFSSTEEFVKENEQHKKAVQSFYASVFSGLMASKDVDQKRALFPVLFQNGEASKEEIEDLETFGFRDVSKAARNLLSLAKGEEFVHVSSETLQDFYGVLPSLLEFLKKAFDPDQALAGLERFVSSYRARNSLLEVFKTVPKMMELLVKLFGISPLLSDILIRNPDFFDVIAAGLIELPTIDKDRWARLQESLEVNSDVETHLLLLREYKNQEIMRIGLRDILGLTSCMETIQELSVLAQYIFEMAMEMTTQFFENKHSKKRPPFVVIGLGKFGGEELGFSSDLDILFVSEGDETTLEEANEFGSMLMDVLSRPMMGGFLYKVDPRLRPDGTKGPLVQSAQGCRNYYVASDEIWERMALSRARVVVGDEDLGLEVIRIIEHYVFKGPVRFEQAEEIKKLREQIYEDRCRGLQEGFELKSGIGGLLDIEYLAQFLQLKHGYEGRELREANTWKLLQKFSYRRILTREEVGLLVEAYLFYREVENALRLVKDRSEDFIPLDSELPERIQKKMSLEPDRKRFFEKLEHFSKVVRFLYQKYVSL